MQAEAKYPGHIFSLSEKACQDEHMNQRERLFEHNRSSFMRIYPYALRVNSSNLDPSFCWRRGAQLVALNWQNLDKAMMLNHGMFHTSPGWVLKPDGYRSGENNVSVAPHHTLDLVVEVFAAQDLSLPPGDDNVKGFKPYVNCQLHVEEPDSPVAVGHDDASSDSEKSSFRRCTKSASGVNPDFGGQQLIFPTVKGVVEELSFIRLVPYFRPFTLGGFPLPSIVAVFPGLRGSCIQALFFIRGLLPLKHKFGDDVHESLQLACADLRIAFFPLPNSLVLRLRGPNGRGTLECWPLRDVDSGWIGA